MRQCPPLRDRFSEVRSFVVQCRTLWTGEYLPVCMVAHDDAFQSNKCEVKITSAGSQKAKRNAGAKLKTYRKRAVWHRGDALRDRGDF